MPGEEQVANNQAALTAAQLAQIQEDRDIKKQIFIKDKILNFII